MKLKILLFFCSTFFIYANDIVTEKLKETAYINLPMLKAKVKDKIYTIEWHYNDKKLTSLSLREFGNEKNEIKLKDYKALKEAIKKLPERSYICYIFSDYGPDFLDDDKIKELSAMSLKLKINFRLFKG